MTGLDGIASVPTPLAVRLPGDPLGIGPGPHPVRFVDWRALDDGDADRFLVDFLGDDFLDALPDAFWRDPSTRRSAWLRPTLEPLALVGGAGMDQLGVAWQDALDVAGVLFLDHSITPPTVVGWDLSPVRGLVAVATSLDELLI